MSGISFVSINVKCPICNKSLMDNEQTVDNEPSIKLNVEIVDSSLFIVDRTTNKDQRSTINDQRNGVIWLSSIYGSFNYICNIDLPENEIVSFFCSHCKSELNGEDLCDVCGAPIVSLLLDMGGRVSFCSRKDCKNHNIGFEDLSEALKKLYQEFGYNDKRISPTQQRLKDMQVPLKEIKKRKTAAEEHKEIIESGSYLMSYCPHCKKSLLTDDMLKLKIINEKGDEGFVMLSPYLNVFSSKSTVYLPEDKLVKDIKCFHCNKSLMADDTVCQSCGSKVARIMVSARTKMVDFYICSKKGCRWHGVNKKDMEDIRLEDSLEW